MTSPQKTALVTGASSGIGYATAIALATAGFKVYAGARRVEEMAPLVRHGCIPVRLDVADEASRQSVVNQILAEDGAVDVLVNNAAFGKSGPLELFPLETMRKQFETNIFGGVGLMQLVIPAMRRKKAGRIINVSSVGGQHTTPLFGSYHGTKYTTEVFSDTLRFELAPFGIDVVVIQPGAVNTPMAHSALDDFTAEPDNPYFALINKFGTIARDSIGKGQGMVEADQVAKAIVVAATAKRPKTRYRVAKFSSSLLVILKRWLTDRGYDWFWKATLKT
jgi:NAD(P)-dependent dehydrogenase (short-subunit alcohol dehydrogenase family)